jgi:hypothetical protein
MFTDDSPSRIRGFVRRRRGDIEVEGGESSKVEHVVIVESAVAREGIEGKKERLDEQVPACGLSGGKVDE